MADNKNGFILYKDIIHTVKKMKKAQRADLFMAILEYVNDLNPVVSDVSVDLVFEPIKQSLKRDLKKFEKKIEGKSESGQLGNLKRWNPDLFDKVVKKEIDLKEALKIAERRIAIKKSQSDNGIANVADIDIGIDIGIGSVSGISDKTEIASKVFLTESEVELLKMQFKGDYDEAINILSNYKNSKGVVYDSDYHAMHSWVKNRINENKLKQPVQSTGSSIKLGRR